MIAFAIQAAGIALIIYGLYKWATLNSDYFAKRGIVHLSPNFVFGNTFGFFLRTCSVYDLTQQIYNAFPKEK